MHEKVEHLFAQKTEKQEDIRKNKLPFLLLTLPLQILFQKFTSKIAINLIVTFNFLFIFMRVTFTAFSNSFLRATILQKISEAFLQKFFELSRRFGGAIL